VGEVREGRMQRLVADVYELAGSLRRNGDRIAGQLGQTQARWQVLSVVSEGAWTVPAVARRLGITRQAVQRVADELAGEGLVAFAGNPSHRRSPLVELTAQGRRTLAAISELAVVWEDEVLEGFDPVEVQRARRLLRRLVARIDEVEQPELPS
jgi:DNA-binding MarR family transcriptional regulator